MECERVVSDTDVTASFYFEESAPFRHVRIGSSIGSISHTPCKSLLVPLSPGNSPLWISFSTLTSDTMIHGGCHKSHPPPRWDCMRLFLETGNSSRTASLCHSFVGGQRRSWKKVQITSLMCRHRCRC